MISNDFLFSLNYNDVYPSKRTLLMIARKRFVTSVNESFVNLFRENSGKFLAFVTVGLVLQYLILIGTPNWLDFNIANIIFLASTHEIPFISSVELLIHLVAAFQFLVFFYYIPQLSLKTDLANFNAKELIQHRSVQFIAPFMLFLAFARGLF